MYDSVEENQFIMVMPKKDVLFNYIHNGIYYYDLEDRHLVLVNTAEENQVLNDDLPDHNSRFHCGSN